MAWWRVALFIGFLAAATSACAGLWGFNPLSGDDEGAPGGADSGPDGGPAPNTEGGKGDAAPPVCGATVCDNPPHATCTGGSTLRSYANGTCDAGQCAYAEIDTTCGAAGCCQDHCCTVVPTNEPVLGDLTKTGITTTAPQGSFDTTANCTTPSALGDCAPVSQRNGPGVCVCRVDDLTIGALTVTGGRALAILAYDKVSITGGLSVAASGVVPGPGAFEVPDGGTIPTDGGASDFVPLVGGFSGGSATCGGGGGGALQITAGTSIGVTGSIDASGGGGRCGGGGGYGGTILLEAPQLDLSGAFGANGGGGSGGAVDSIGGQQGTDGTATAGGSGGGGASEFCCDLGGTATGGRGGDGASASVPASGGGGGVTVCNCFQCCLSQFGASGGGLGLIGIHSLGGACSCGGGTFSPVAEVGELVVR